VALVASINLVNTNSNDANENLATQYQNISLSADNLLHVQQKKSISLTLERFKRLNDFFLHDNRSKTPELSKL